LSADYSQIEYRLAVHFSGDQGMIVRYAAHPDTDYHSETAELCGIDRRKAKTVNFGILYGMGARSLSSLLDVSESSARDLLELVFSKRPALRRLIGDVEAEARRNRSVSTPFGRRIVVPEKKCFVALNYLLQGTASDVVKRAMVRLSKALREGPPGLELHLQLHDELVLSVPFRLVSDAVRILRSTMERFPEISVPLRCNFSSGSDWGSMERLKNSGF